MRIKVTQNHINLGQPKCRYACPIALALREATGLSPSVGGYISLSDAEGHIVIKAYRTATSEEREFMKAFDHGRPVEPFEMEIDYENPTDE